MHRMIGTARVALLMLWLAPAAGAQVVKLRITDYESEEPIPRALVTVLNEGSQARSDSTGHAVLAIHHGGTTVFTIRRFGFVPITTTLDVPARDTFRVHVILRPAPTVLDTVSVSADAPANRFIARGVSAFDYRSTHTVGGHFITREDIERRRPFETLDLFRNVLGVRVVSNSRFQHMILSSRGLANTNGSCLMSVGVDGVVYGGASDDDFDVNDLSPSDIYGIEVYSGAATIPGEYLGATLNRRCGLIMIWTRTGANERPARP